LAFNDDVLFALELRNLLIEKELLFLGDCQAPVKFEAWRGLSRTAQRFST
jgi:hypothetical protein